MKQLTLSLVLALFSVGARAADTATSLPAAPAAAETSSAAATDAGIQKKFEDDKKITDAELKSRAGSLSRFSLKADLKYYGPTVENLSSADQPNPDGAVSATAVGPKGSLGARYRLDPSTSLTANIGFTDQYLFTSKPTNWDMSNPYVTYDKSFKIGSVQVVASPGLTLVTSNVYRPKGERAGIDGRIYASQAIGDTAMSVGTSLTASYYLFDRDYIPDHQVGFDKSKKKPIISGDGKIARTSVTFAPNVKYNVTQKFNVTTSLGFNFFNPRYYDTAFKYQSRLVNQWVGVGYAITRDIYINPYIQIYPTDFSWKTTTLNLSTVISLL